MRLSEQRQHLVGKLQLNTVDADLHSTSRGVKDKKTSLNVSPSPRYAKVSTHVGFPYLLCIWN